MGGRALPPTRLFTRHGGGGGGGDQSELEWEVRTRGALGVE